MGGIEASAAVAWDALRSNRDARLIVYDPAGRVLPGDAGPAIVGASKLGLVAGLLVRSWRADVLVCWHLGLLKLVPFLRGFRGRVCLFLHGIEAWHRHGWLTRRLLTRVDHFLSNSQFTWERLLEYVPELAGCRHTTVPLGLGDSIAITGSAPASPPVP